MDLDQRDEMMSNAFEDMEDYPQQLLLQEKLLKPALFKKNFTSKAGGVFGCYLKTLKSSL